MTKYYAEREQKLNPIEFPIIRYSFSQIYQQFFYDKWFAEAGFHWAYSNLGLFMFQKLGYWDIWPFGTMILGYNEEMLFSVIEFLYGYTYNNTIFGEYKCLEDGQKEYRTMVNDILRFYKGGYELSKDGQIQKLSPPGFEPLIAETIETNDPENIDAKYKHAISGYSRYNSSIEDKEAALIELCGVLEYLQKRGVKLPEKDDGDLFRIMNEFNLRHKNRKQHSEYNEEVWYEWFFYTFLASVHVLLKLNDKKFDPKIPHTEN